jgi:hypothetical protein
VVASGAGAAEGRAVGLVSFHPDGFRVELVAVFTGGWLPDVERPVVSGRLARSRSSGRVFRGVGGVPGNGRGRTTSGRGRCGTGGRGGRTGGFQGCQSGLVGKLGRPGAPGRYQPWRRSPTQMLRRRQSKS